MKEYRPSAEGLFTGVCNAVIWFVSNAFCWPSYLWAASASIMSSRFIISSSTWDTAGGILSFPCLPSDAVYSWEMGHKSLWTVIHYVQTCVEQYSSKLHPGNTALNCLERIIFIQTSLLFVVCCLLWGKPKDWNPNSCLPEKQAT